jgi:hypothetical protein
MPGFPPSQADPDGCPRRRDSPGRGWTGRRRPDRRLAHLGLQARAPRSLQNDFRSVALLGLHFFQERLNNSPLIIGHFERGLQPLVHSLAKILEIASPVAAILGVRIVLVLLRGRNDRGGCQRRGGQQNGFHF